MEGTVVVRRHILPFGADGRAKVWLPVRANILKADLSLPPPRVIQPLSPTGLVPVVWTMGPTEEGQPSGYRHFRLVREDQVHKDLEPWMYLETINSQQKDGNQGLVFVLHIFVSMDCLCNQCSSPLDLDGLCTKEGCDYHTKPQVQERPDG